MMGAGSMGLRSLHVTVPRPPGNVNMLLRARRYSGQIELCLCNLQAPHIELVAMSTISKAKLLDAYASQLAATHPTEADATPGGKRLLDRGVQVGRVSSLLFFKQIQKRWSEQVVDSVV